MLFALLILALLTYYLVTGTRSLPSAPIEKTAQEAGLPGGSFKSGEDIKKRVEEMLQKRAEEQQKAIDESAR